MKRNIKELFKEIFEAETDKEMISMVKNFVYWFALCVLFWLAILYLIFK